MNQLVSLETSTPHKIVFRKKKESIRHLMKKLKRKKTHFSFIFTQQIHRAKKEG